MKVVKALQCAAIVQPGEYTIDHWDGERCTEKSGHMLIKCQECGNYYCLMQHWHRHSHSDPIDTEKANREIREGLRAA